LLLQSNDFQTSWNQTNITRTLNSILSPSGNVDGVKIEATAAAATGLLQAATIAATAATGSVYVKQGTSATVANSFVLRNFTTSTNLIIGSLNYSTGVFTYTTGSTGVVVTNVGNGWWRIALSATTGITSGDSMALYVGFSGGVFAAGDFLYAYGAQLEQGAFATSYIPTTTSQLTRAVDVANIGTVSPWFNKQAGTIFAEASIYTTVGLGVLTAFNNGAFYATGSGFLLRTDGVNVSAGGNSSNVNIAPISANTVFRAAGGYQGVNQLVGLNGATPSSNALCDFTGVGTAALTIGSLAAGSGTQQTNGWIRRISYYPRRLSDTELQTLTTL
jgi:hypothetical protein